MASVHSESQQGGEGIELILLFFTGKTSFAAAINMCAKASVQAFPFPSEISGNKQSFLSTVSLNLFQSVSPLHAKANDSHLFKRYHSFCLLGCASSTALS